MLEKKKEFYISSFSVFLFSKNGKIRSKVKSCKYISFSSFFVKNIDFNSKKV